MDKLIIKGQNKLKGFINVHGAKNSALPILVSSLLSDNNLTLTNIPKVDDISKRYHQLEQHFKLTENHKNE